MVRRIKTVCLTTEVTVSLKASKSSLVPNTQHERVAVSMLVHKYKLIEYTIAITGEKYVTEYCYTNINLVIAPRQFVYTIQYSEARSWGWMDQKLVAMPIRLQFRVQVLEKYSLDRHLIGCDQLFSVT